MAGAGAILGVKAAAVATGHQQQQQSLMMDAASSTPSQTTAPLLVLGMLLLTIVLAWVVPVVLHAHQEATRLAAEEARALEAVRCKRLAAVSIDRAAPEQPGAVEEQGVESTDQVMDEGPATVDSGSTCSSRPEGVDAVDSIAARELRGQKALARRGSIQKRPSSTSTAAKTPATAPTAAVPVNPLSAGAVETAARFPFLREWKAEARAALQQALKTRPPPSPQLRQTLLRLLTHIVAHPHDARYRTFRRGNPAFAALWGQEKGKGEGEGEEGPFRALLWKLGFKEEEGRDGAARVVSFAVEPTAAHLEVMRGLVAMLGASSSCSSYTSLAPLPQPPPPMEFGGQESVAVADNNGEDGWGTRAAAGGWGWRRSAPVPRNRQPGRGPWG